MTTVPARSLSGDHLGRVVRFVDQTGREITGSVHEIEHSHYLHHTFVTLGNGDQHKHRPVPFSTPVTIEDTE